MLPSIRVAAMNAPSVSVNDMRALLRQAGVIAD
jgi:hypothetical protein